MIKLFLSFFHNIKNNRGFTLVELVIVTAVIGILATAATAVLNPVELLNESRDSRRISDIQSINEATYLYQTNNGDFSALDSNKVYVSVPDDIGSGDCSGISPALPTISGKTYACKNSANYRKVDGNGWLPLNFASVGTGAPWAALPIDPTNTSVGGFYEFTYSGGDWHIATSLISKKYGLNGTNDRVSTDKGALDTQFETGSNLSLLPATTVTSFPSRVTGLGSSLSGTTVNLTWSAATANGSAVTAYKIYRGTTSGSGTLIATLGNVLNYADSTISTGTTYYYSVSAVNSLGEGARSYESSIAYALAPSQVTGLSATNSGMVVGLNWSAASPNGGAITSYKIYRGISAGTGTLLTSVSNTLNYSDSSGAVGTTYYYSVSAVNSAGEGTKSTESSITYLLTPSQVAGLTSSRSGSTVTLNWSAATANGSAVTAYKVYRGTSSGAGTLLTTLGNVLTYADSTVTSGASYYYSVSAINNVGEGIPSSESIVSYAIVPSAPTNLARTISGSNIVLTWTAATPNGAAVTNYKIYRGTSSGTETLLTTTGNVLTYADAAITFGNPYYYKVSAVNPAGEGSLSSEVNILYTFAPSQVIGLTRTISGSTIILNWLAATNNGSTVTAYKIYRSTSTGTETLLATLGNVLTYTDSAITLSTPYYYKVSAVNGIGEGLLSSEVDILYAGVPSAPTGLTGSSSGSAVVLNWTASASAGSTVISYRVYRSTATGTESLLATINNVLTYTDSAVTLGTTYYYKVSAINSVGEGALSTEINVLYATPPGVPGNLARTISGSTIVLTWTAATANGSAVTNYKIYRGTSTNTETLLASAGNVLTYTDSAIVLGTPYYYKVSAVNSIGEGVQFSSEVNILYAIAPAQVTGLTPSRSGSTIVLNWSAATANGSAVTAYKVYRSTTTGTETLLATLGNVLTYTDSAVSLGITYYYKVSAVNSVGEGSQSAEANIIAATVPSAPTGLTRTISGATIVLNWTAAAANGLSVTNYKIYRGTSSGTETLLTTLGNVLTYTDSAITLGTPYYYTVSAVNSVGESAQSSEVNILYATIPSQVIGLTSSRSGSTVTLNWSAATANGSAVTAYKIYRGISTGTGTLLTTLGNVLTYADSTIVSGNVYYYSVSAVNSVGEGTKSTESSVVYAGSPSAPGSLARSISGSAIVLTWTAATDNQAVITNYKIYRGTSSGTEILLTTIGNLLTYTDSAITLGTSYYYKVSAVNSVGEGVLSSEVNILYAKIPDAPTGLTSVLSGATIVLNWSAATANGSAVTAYKVYRSTTTGTETLLTTLGNVLTYTDSAITVGATYYYKVSATNSVGEGLLSSESNATYWSAPSQVTGLTRTIPGATIVLNWSAATANGSAVTAYKVYRSTTTGTETLLTTLGNVLTYTDSAVSIGTSYYYTVAAVNALGTGPQSAEVNILYATSPSAPVGFTGTSGSTQVVLNWTASSPNGSAITGYKVYRNTVPATPVLVMTLGNVLTWTNTGLTDGTTYYFRVVGTNSVGDSAYSSEISLASSVGDYSNGAGGAYICTSCTNAQHASAACQSKYGTGACTTGSCGSFSYYYPTTGRSCDCSTVPGEYEWIYSNSGYTQVGQDYGGQATSVSGNSLFVRQKSSAVCDTNSWVLALSNLGSARAISLPSAPTGLTRTITGSTIVLNWSAATGNGYSVTNYNIYRSTASGAETLFATVGNVLTYTDSAVSIGTSYYYKVSALSSMGEGSQSSEVNILYAKIPDAPTGLTSVLSGATIVLNWSAATANGSAVTAYKVYRSTTTGTETLLTTLGNVLTYTDSAITVGATYYYKVSATNSVGESSLSSEANATYWTAPAQVSGLTRVITGSTIVLNWSAATANGSVVTAYKVYRSTSSGTETLFTTIGNLLTYTDSAITLGTSYYYKVSAVNAIGEGPQSSEVNILYAKIPDAPTGLSGTIGGGQVTLSWSAAVNNGSVITAYKVYRSTSPSATTLVTTLGNVLTWTNTGLTGGTLYYFRITATNSVGDSAYSSEISATPEVAYYSNGASGGYVCNNCTNAQHASAACQSKYGTGACTTGSCGSFSYYYPTTGRSCDCSTVPGEYEWIYSNSGYTQVGQDYGGQATSVSGNSLFVRQKSSAVCDTNSWVLALSNLGSTLAAPSAPTGLTRTITGSTIVLNWSAAAGNVLTNYKIYRSTSSGTETLLTTLGNVLTYTDSAVSIGTAYYYKVSAVNAVGEGSQSSEVNILYAALPSAPTGLSGTPGGNQVTLNWSAAVNNGSAITAYKVYRNTSPSATTLVATLGNVLTWTNTGLTGGTTYYFRITATNSVGDSAYSSEISSVPTTQTIVTLGYTGALQTWTVPATGSYHIEAWGAQGSIAATLGGTAGSAGGLGGYAYGDVSLASGTVLNIYVGGAGGQGSGGWNGGGSGAYSSTNSGCTPASGYGGTGGGASDVRTGGTALTNRIIVAGGGGGGGTSYNNCGGNAGGAGGASSNTGSNNVGGTSYGGVGGSVSAGGAGGSVYVAGSAGSSGQGGAAGSNGSCQYGGAGGGGGGGYYGGGGGGSNQCGQGYGGAGGGGGSSYTGGMTSGAGTTATVQSGNGSVKITY